MSESILKSFKEVLGCSDTCFKGSNYTLDVIKKLNLDERRLHICAPQSARLMDGALSLREEEELLYSVLDRSQLALLLEHHM